MCGNLKIAALLLWQMLSARANATQSLWFHLSLSAIPRQYSILASWQACGKSDEKSPGIGLGLWVSCEKMIPKGYISICGLMSFQIAVNRLDRQSFTHTFTSYQDRMVTLRILEMVSEGLLQERGTINSDLILLRVLYYDWIRLTYLAELGVIYVCKHQSNTYFCN